MGRRQGKRVQGKKKDKSNKNHKPTKTSKNLGNHENGHKYGVDQLLEQAEGCLDQFNYELAEKFCQRARQSQPDNVCVLEMLGGVQLETGDTDGAKQCFGRAIELEPDTGHAKYMYMGQLLTGDESAGCFLKGIELMKQSIGEQTGGQACGGAEVDNEVSIHDISSAYCSVAEIYLTDACFEADAQIKCKQSLDDALKVDNKNPEVFHLLASYHMSVDDKKAAEEYIDKGLELWLPQLREAEKPSSSQAESFDPVQVCSVSYPARVNAVKILIELKKYEIAVEVLELLLDEDDCIVEVWYLLGWVNYLQGDDYKTNARYYLGKAQKVAKETRCEDQDLCTHVQELVQELGPGEGDNTDDEDGDVDAEAGEMEIDSSEDEDASQGHGESQQTSKHSQGMEH